MILNDFPHIKTIKYSAYHSRFNCEWKLFPYLWQKANDKKMKWMKTLSL